MQKWAPKSAHAALPPSQIIPPISLFYQTRYTSPPLPYSPFLLFFEPKKRCSPFILISNIINAFYA